MSQVGITLPCSLQLAACSLQLAACSLQLAACSLQLAACSLQLAACKKPPTGLPAGGSIRLGLEAGA
ncbi:elongation factor P-like protein [Halomonas beimenensis]|uniref:Elongation factor P-like protein n=1 Tax=Halomonas beimenensis TaxID=475662 RepID=A0A291P6K1_9GAMM|nr:elongation factor P-like protein [Halomonas beimenensis]